jgi:hypothetical protein
VDVITRITKATAAFGALHYCFFSNQRVSLKDKGRVYAVLVLTILLHGSECWSLRERTLCRVKMRQVSVLVSGVPWGPSVRLVSSSGLGAHDLPSGGPNGYFSVKHVKTVIFQGAPI